MSTNFSNPETDHNRRIDLWVEKFLLISTRTTDFLFVWRFSSCCSTAFCNDKAVPFLQWSERSLCFTHVQTGNLCSNSLEARQNSVNLNWRRPSCSSPTSADSLIHRLVHSLQRNEMAFTGLSGSFNWDNEKHPWMTLFNAHEHSDAAPRLASAFLHRAALCCGGCTISVHVSLCILHWCWSLWHSSDTLYVHSFNFSATCKQQWKKKKTIKMTLFHGPYKTYKLKEE